MDAQLGDRLVIEGNQVGAPRRTGVVVQILGQSDRRHYQVRWDDGHESVFFPSSDTVVERADPSAPAPPMRVTTQVELRFEEDEDHTDAWATLRTEAGNFTGWGRARRSPVDPNVPLVGEELAAARALMDLAGGLQRAAGQTMAAGDRPAAHIVG